MNPKLLITLLATAGLFALSACENVEQDLFDGDEMSAFEAESALTTRYADKYTLGFDTLKSNTLSNSATSEVIHRYKYIAPAGQTVTFGLAIPTSSGGAWLGMTTSSSLPTDTYVNQTLSTTDTIVQFQHTFTTAATVYLWVRQATPAVGSFAYKLSTRKERCATMSGKIYDNYNVPSSGWWTLFGAKHFPAGSTENPSTWKPSVEGGTFSSYTRSVKVGSCISNQTLNCGTSGPATCEGDFMGYGPVANSCEAKNGILYRADNNGEWNGWYQPTTAQSPCYGM